MSISMLDQARVYVAQHQTFNSNTHKYRVWWKGHGFTGNSTDELVLMLARVMAKDVQDTWRRRIGCDEWTS